MTEKLYYNSISKSLSSYYRQSSDGDVELTNNRD